MFFDAGKIKYPPVYDNTIENFVYQTLKVIVVPCWSLFTGILKNRAYLAFEVFSVNK